MSRFNPTLIYVRSMRTRDCRKALLSQCERVCACCSQQSSKVFKPESGVTISSSFYVASIVHQSGYEWHPKYVLVGKQRYARWHATLDRAHLLTHNSNNIIISCRHTHQEIYCRHLCMSTKHIIDNIST